MTTEPRQEAEEIVGDFVIAEVEQATEPSESAMYVAGAYRGRLVDALAAAIKWQELIHRSMDEDEDFGYSMTGTEFELLRALSALREDET